MAGHRSGRVSAEHWSGPWWVAGSDCRQRRRWAWCLETDVIDPGRPASSARYSRRHGGRSFTREPGESEGEGEGESELDGGQLTDPINSNMSRNGDLLPQLTRPQ